MKQKWWNSLRTKIIAWSFVPTVIILSAVAWFTFYSYQKVIGDLAIKQYPEMVQPKALAFSDAFRGLINPIVVPIYLDIDNNPELPLEARAQNILDKTQGLEVFDGGIYFLDQQGKIFKTVPEGSELLGQDWSDTPHFRSIHEKPNGTAFTDLIPVGATGKKIFCFATAMVGQAWDDVVGAYYLCYTIRPAAQNNYYTTMSSLDLGSNFRILDRNQQIVFSSVSSEMGKDLSTEAYIQQLSQGKVQSGHFRIGTEDMVVSYVPLTGGPSDQRAWFVLSEESWSEIMQPSLPYRQLLLVLLALGVIVPVLVTAYGVRHITEPIQKLIHASEQVTAGQFKHRIEVKTGDEIETLADQFNVMSAELDESYSSLEKKVADRTRELAIMNAILSVTNRSLDLREILEDALKIIVEQMGFEVHAAFKYETDRAAPVLITQRSLEPATARDILNITALKNELNAVDQSFRTAVFEIKDLPDEKLRDGLLGSGLQMLVQVPLTTKGRLLGSFILGKRELQPLSLEELSLLSSIGQQIGVAMENAHLYEQAEQTAISAERNRLARELHDAVTQTLFSANLIADVTPQIWKRNPEEGMQNLEELRLLTRGALAEMRTMLLEMRPETLERVDLKALLIQLADAFIGRVRVPVALDIQGTCELTHEVKLAFYRVAQEALNNIAKHSGARQVKLRLECQPGQMLLLIRDDGLGFDPASITPDHLGIAIMRERANSIGAGLKIESQVGQGTTVELNWRLTRED